MTHSQGRTDRGNTTAVFAVTTMVTMGSSLMIFGSGAFGLVAGFVVAVAACTAWIAVDVLTARRNAPEESPINERRR